MRYIIALALVLCSLVVFVVEGDATILALAFCISMYLIWSRYDWTKIKYGDPRREK